MINFLTSSVIESEYDRLAFKANELSIPVQNGLEPVNTDQKTYDYVGLLNRGWEWLFEFMKNHQPKVYNRVSQSSPSLYVGERFWNDRLDPSRLHWNANAFLKFDERYLVVRPYLMNGSIEEIQKRHPCYRRFCSLPLGIAESYYMRIECLEVVHKLPVNPMESRVLPGSIFTWKGVDTLCSKKKEKEDLHYVLNAIADQKSSGVSDLGKDFRIMLDTREQDDFGPIGDFLIIQVGSDSKRIFYVKNKNFGDIEKVRDPVLLLDDYVDYVLSDSKEKFDFSSYVGP